jgi:KaiC/GvpD/RAD55 family RecA-like ATPase
MSPQQRFHRRNPCPICGGYDEAARGQGKRCFGFLSNDGEFAHCTRDELAGGIEQNPDSGTYPHRLRGRCKCGQEHGPSEVPQRQIVATYLYTDEHGKLLFEVIRYSPKSFAQRRADGAWKLGDVRRVLYRLPEILAAECVYLVEGEKDVETLRERGLTATCNPHGAGKWRDHYAQSLAGKLVVVLPDNDDEGRRHALRAAQSLLPVARGVKLVELPGLPKKGDVSDWLTQGHGKDELLQVVKAAPVLDAGGLSALRAAWFPEQVAHKKAERLTQFFSPEQILSGAGGVDSFLRPQPGLQTPWRALNDLTCGLHNGELCLVAARPSMGKTWIALQIAYYVAKSSNGCVALFSLEMSKESLLRRLIAQEARVDGQRLRRGELDKEERRRIAAALGEIARAPLFISDNTKATVQGVCAALRGLAAQHKLALVVIDYLGLMTGRGRDRNAEVSGISRELKLAAKEFNVPFLVLSQLSRAPEVRGGDNRRPVLSDLRDSGTLEQDADLVLMLYRAEMYKPDDPSVRGKAELAIAKQRNGPTEKIELDFRRDCGRFDERGMR